MNTERIVEFHPDFSSKISNYRTLLIEADVVNQETGDKQKDEMNELASAIAERLEVSDINKIPAIAATRMAYKLCGKDPNRYRPSQEQLMRRIVRGLGLYNVNALVDAGNMLSLRTGCSVGCFDAEIVEGNILTLGVGKEDEPYEGIGRGQLNIAGLPVFRDAKGGIGTPTSDNERTKLSLATRKLVVTVHLFDSQIDHRDILHEFTRIFTTYGQASNIRHTLFSPQPS